MYKRQRLFIIGLNVTGEWFSDSIYSSSFISDKRVVVAVLVVTGAENDGDVGIFYNPNAVFKVAASGI